MSEDHVYLHVSYSGETRNPIGSVAPLSMLVAIGFGQAIVTVDGKPLLDGEPHGPYRERSSFDAEIEGAPASYTWKRLRHWSQCDKRSWRITHGGRYFLTIARVERYLAHRARSGAPVEGKIECHINGPLWDATWERRAPNEWVCTKAGEGFA